MKPLWFIKYDPIRIEVFGVDGMRFTSKHFTRLRDAMDEIDYLSMEKAYSFVEYAVVRRGESSDKIEVQGTIDYDEV